MALEDIGDPVRLRKLVDALLAIGSDLSLPIVLKRIVESAVDLVGARYGALGVLDDEGHGLSEFVTVGISDDQIAAIGPLPEGHGILGLLIIEPEPLRLRELGTHRDSYGFPPGHPEMNSFLGVPIRIRGQVFGNLYLTEKQGSPEFSDDDEALAVALAGAAAIAIDNARLHGRVGDLAMVHDRERIAADLHDTVIQRLFATGLALEGTLGLAPPDVGGRIERAVADLDETIRQIRTAIFALQRPRPLGQGLRAAILALATESAASLGFQPTVRLDGPLDTIVDREVADNVLATLREAVSNVVRHARASEVEVVVTVTDDELLAVVTDNGEGPTGVERQGGRGLENMRARALALGGLAMFEAGPDGGARLSWRVPLKRSS
jgi:signal transduction histidine kinase